MKTAWDMRTVWDMTLYCCIAVLAVILYTSMKAKKEAPPPVVRCECVCPVTP